MISGLLAASTPSLDVWSLVMESGPMAKFVLLVLAILPPVRGSMPLV